MVGRVWPRHGHRGRPLNSVVARPVETLSKHSPLERARSQRSQRNWLALGFVAVGLIPTTIAIVLDIFPGAPPKYIFGVGVGISGVIAFCLHASLARRQGLPKCPNCGAELAIVESGPHRNVDTLDTAGVCTRCGATL
jgi:hypothetical protein